MEKNGHCSKCRKEKEHKTKRYCLSCAAEWMRNWRRTQEKLPPTEAERTKLRARALIKMRLRRGTLKRQRCEKCGKEKSHAHHEDYSKPDQVTWLCSMHHRHRHLEMEVTN